MSEEIEKLSEKNFQELAKSGDELIRRSLENLPPSEKDREKKLVIDQYFRKYWGYYYKLCLAREEISNLIYYAKKSIETFEELSNLRRMSEYVESKLNEIEKFITDVKNSSNIQTKIVELYTEPRYKVTEEEKEEHKKNYEKLRGLVLQQKLELEQLSDKIKDIKMWLRKKVESYKVYKEEVDDLARELNKRGTSEGISKCKVTCSVEFSEIPEIKSKEYEDVEEILIRESSVDKGKIGTMYDKKRKKFIFTVSDFEDIEKIMLNESKTRTAMNINLENFKDGQINTDQ